MHERSPKNKPIDVVLYEIEMFRHCALSLSNKYSSMWNSQVDRAEYYLGLEGFLLHLRNLLAFFMNHCTEPTDLGINRTQQWARDRAVKPQDYSDLMKAARDINEKFQTDNGSLYVQISRFLQHCTTFRYTSARSWDVEGIFAEFDPVLTDFVERFVGKEAVESD
jgi:hypothetical protein